MRIIAGQYKGRKLLRPPSLITRPTMDRVREALFNIIAHTPCDRPYSKFHDAVILDAFGGSGALAIEALSRGACFATIFEIDAQAYQVIEANISTLRESKRTNLLRASALQPPPCDKCMDIVFLDPPFGKNLVDLCLSPLEKSGWIGKGTWVAGEIERKEELVVPEHASLKVHRRYGSVQIFVLEF